MRKETPIWFFLIFLFPFAASAQDNGISIGFGFSVLTPHQETDEVKEDRKYNFEHLTYFHQWRMFKNVYFVLEPFLGYVNKPERGIEFGVNFLLRYYLETGDRTSLFFNLGGGGLIRPCILRNRVLTIIFFLQEESASSGGIILLKTDSVTIPIPIWPSPMNP